MSIPSSAVPATPVRVHFGAPFETPANHGTASAQFSASSRPFGDAPGDGSAAPSALRAQGNKELAVSYANALAQRTHDEDTIIPTIPPQSSFGQWREQLRQALEDKDFLNWLQTSGYKVSTLKILPDGSLSVSRNNQRVLFTLQDNSPWATFAGPILTALKAYAPQGITHADLFADGAPLSLVAQFYAETIDTDPSVARQRAQELQASATFATAGSGNERSEDMLGAHKRHFADKRDLAKFVDGLTRASAKAETYLDQQAALHNYNHLGVPDAPAYDRNAGLQAFLQTQQIKLDPDSGFHLDKQPMAGQSVNLLQFMTGHDWDHPTNMDELENLRAAMMRPLEYTQKQGDFGGGLSWPTPLDPQQQQAIYDAVTYNAMGLPEFDKLNPSQSVFGYLTQTTQWSEDELKDPRQAVFKLMQDPALKTLGEALRAKFEGAGDPIDWALAALQISLNPAALWKPEEKNKLAGFDLSAPELFGKPLSFVRERLTEHLSKSYGNNAPVAAYLLLSFHAPELLVKDVPDDVGYYSPGFVSLKAIVAKAQMRTPGLAPTKTYGQLLAEDLNPISAAEKQVEALAGQEGLIHWAVADGAIAKRADNNYTDEEIERAGALASERFEVLEKASAAQNRTLYTRKELALKALKARFPGDIDFEKKTIFPAENYQWLQGPYSILDIYMQPQQHVKWVSNDPQTPIEKIAHDLKFLPSVNEQYETQAVEYYDGLKGAMETSIKHRMSLLSDEDKEVLQLGKIEEIYGEEKVTQTTTFAGYKIQYDVSQTEEVKSGSVFIEMLHKGSKRIYEVNPTTGVLRHRADMADGVKTGLQGQWEPVATGKPKVRSRTNTRIKRLSADTSAEKQQREPISPASLPIHTFTSPRTQYLADAVTRHFSKAHEREAVINAARGATTFETEVTEFEKIQAVTRSLLPLASAVHSFQEGRVVEGLGFLAIDLFGFAYNGATALGKLSTLAKVGGQAGRGGTVGRLGRALISAANPFAGGRAMVKKGLPLFDTALGRGLLSWKVIAANRAVNKVYQNRPKDVVQGTLKGAENTKVTAQLDELSAKWYRFDLSTGQKYGMPLQGFVAENTAS